jgi:NAD(P) transhydrogenase
MILCLVDARGGDASIRFGQAVLSLGGKLDYFVDTVFNYPTLAECYKTD